MCVFFVSLSSICQMIIGKIWRPFSIGVRSAQYAVHGTSRIWCTWYLITLLRIQAHTTFNTVERLDETQHLQSPAKSKAKGRSSALAGTYRLAVSQNNIEPLRLKLVGHAFKIERSKRWKATSRTARRRSSDPRTSETHAQVLETRCCLMTFSTQLDLVLGHNI